MPIAYSVRSGGRPENPADKYTSKYLDLPNSPQFPFGHGLSYTRFALTDPVATGTGPITVETTVTNTGPRPGTTTVFLFIRDPVATVARPVLELKRFETVDARPGREPLRFASSSTADDFAFPGADLRPTVEPGAIEIHVGFSADPAGLRSTSAALR